MARIVRVVRNVEFNRLFDAFFVSAISTILLIRFYLSLTGYPQIGGSVLHISHLLPGSLIMLAAFLVLLAAVNRAAREFAAILGGIGFGFVWDELGKFITKDNNYFFKATPGLIYLTFVCIYLIVRQLGRRRLSSDDYLANVMDLIKDAAVKDLDRREYEHAVELFRHVNKNHPLYKNVSILLEEVRPDINAEKTLTDKMIDELLLPLRRMTEWRHFPMLISFIAILYGLASLLSAIFFFAGAFGESLSFSILKGDESDFIGAVSFSIAAVISFVAYSFYIQGKKRKAYRWFEQALLVNILIGQVVLFFKNSGIAMTWLAVTLFLLINLQILVTDLKRHHAA